MEVDLKEASLFTEYIPETRILIVYPNIEFQGRSEVEVSLTSEHGVQVIETFRIWVTFTNMGIYKPELPEVIDIDPVGRREVVESQISTVISHISSTG